jgi:K(+)-stimulated pyrophosphate-energized sodium pump
MNILDFDVRFFQIASIIISILAFGAAVWLYKWVVSQPSSNKKIAEVSKLIRNGANTFLAKEYRTLIRFCTVAAIIILVFLPAPIWKGNVVDNILMAVSYLFGTVFSGIAGKIGISIATIANVKAAEASTKGIKPAFMSGFRGGAVMGMAVVGSSLLGVTLVLLLTDNTTALLGFSFGASSMALFAKAGGGIFTKTADISADLCGKVELGIPEDDPRNPAVIADNVGDNVGDVAGMGADLFDSNVASMAAALVMASALDKVAGGTGNAAMVFCYAAIGLFASMIGVLTAKMKENGDPTRALNSNTYVTTILFGVLTAVATVVFDFEWRIWGASAVGLVVGVVIGIASDYYTDDKKKPVHEVAKACESGPAFTILSGISYGLLSTLPSMIGIGVSALAAFKI